MSRFRKLPFNDGTFSNAVVIGPSGVVVSATIDDVSINCSLEPTCPRAYSRPCRAGAFRGRSSGRLRRSIGWWLRPRSVSVLRPTERPLAVGVSDADARAMLSGAPPFAQEMLALAVQLESCRNEPDADAGVVRLALRFGWTPMEV